MWHLVTHRLTSRVVWHFLDLLYFYHFTLNMETKPSQIRCEILSQTNFCLISHLISYLKVAKEVVKSRKFCFKNLRKTHPPPFVIWWHFLNPLSPPLECHVLFAWPQMYFFCRKSNKFNVLLLIHLPTIQISEVGRGINFEHFPFKI